MMAKKVRKIKALADIDVFDELIKSPDIPKRFKAQLEMTCGKLDKNNKGVCARGFFEGFTFCEEVVKESIEFKQGGE